MNYIVGRCDSINCLAAYLKLAKYASNRGKVEHLCLMYFSSLRGKHASVDLLSQHACIYL